MQEWIETAREIGRPIPEPMTKKPGFCDNLAIEPKILAKKPGFCLNVMKQED